MLMSNDSFVTYSHEIVLYQPHIAHHMVLYMSFFLYTNSYSQVHQIVDCFYQLPLRSVVSFALTLSSVFCFANSSSSLTSSASIFSTLKSTMSFCSFFHMIKMHFTTSTAEFPSVSFKK